MYRTLEAERAEFARDVPTQKHVPNVAAQVKRSVESDVTKQHETAETRAAATDVKLIGLTILTYAQDNEHTFPKTGNDFERKLTPYISGNKDLPSANVALLRPLHGFGSFVYIFPGGKVSDDAAATTILGYKDGLHDRLNLFADGHVKLAGGRK